MTGLREKILSRQAVTCVIGLGYVGLPLAVELAKAGFKVVGVDLDSSKVARLMSGDSYIIDVSSADLLDAVRSGRLVATTDFSELKRADTISICVPTPLRKTKDPDISYINAAMDQVVKYVHPNILVILESTTYPGTTEELVQARLEEAGFTVGKDFSVCFSPERVDPGNPSYNTKNTPKVIGGATPVCRELGALLYGAVMQKVIPVSSTRVAEMVKLLENTFRAVNIGLVNELALMCERMNIDVWEVVDAASTKPFGFLPFYPGPGIGGHCIPLDPMYLSWKAKMFDFYNKFIELASDVNGNMPRHVVSIVSEALNTQRKCLNQARILILGMAYKKDIDDVRESPGLEIFRLLRRSGSQVDYNDPLVRSFLDEAGYVIHSTELDQRRLAQYDCVLLITNHTSYDYDFIARNSALVVDTRNAFKGQIYNNVVKLGTGGWQESQRFEAEVAAAAERPACTPISKDGGY